MELTTIGFILVPAWPAIAAWLLIGLGLVFLVAQTSALIRKLDISCGCFGDDDTKIGVRTLASPIALLMVGLLTLTLIGVSDKLTVAAAASYYGFGIIVSAVGTAIVKTVRVGTHFDLAR